MDENTLSCAVVQDLAALYTDGEASTATAAAVEAHLSTCRDCRDYYKKYKQSGVNRTSAAAETAAPAADGYARIARRLRRRSALEKGGFVLGALLLAAFAFAAAMLLEKAEAAKKR